MEKIIFDGYSVTDDGRVFSTKSGEKREMKQYHQHISGIFYPTVGLHKAGYAKNFYVHRLVAEAFIPNPENALFVKHIDGDTLNNHVSNLEWHTKQARRYVPVAKSICQRCGKEHCGENELCRRCNNTKRRSEATKANRKAKAESIEFREIKFDKHRDIVNAYRQGELKSVIARQHGTSEYHIRRIINLYKIG